MNTLKKDILVIFLFLVSLNSLGRDIDIGVFRGHSIQQIDFSYYQGDYLIQGDSTSFGRLQANEFVSIIQHENGVELKKGVRSMGRFDTIYLRPTIFNAGLRLRPRSPVLKARKYRDEFRITAGKGGLTIVNRVSYTHYLGGVIESEGGGGKDEEYYKAQAVISRTYALKHINKHQNEGFDLCDQVHCQAYHNMLIYTDEIKDAVKATQSVTAIPVNHFKSASIISSPVV
jgi:stage II sporulation protein D